MYIANICIYHIYTYMKTHSTYIQTDVQTQNIYDAKNIHIQKFF